MKHGYNLSCVKIGEVKPNKYCFPLHFKFTFINSFFLSNCVFSFRNLNMTSSCFQMPQPTMSTYFPFFFTNMSRYPKLSELNSNGFSMKQFERNSQRHFSVSSLSLTHFFPPFLSLSFFVCYLK